NQQRFLRLQKPFELLEFLNQRHVNFLPAGRVEDPLPRRSLGGGGSMHPFNSSRCRTLDIFLVCVWCENWNVDLLSERRELLDRRRPLQIERHQQRRAPLFLKQSREFRGGSCFSRTVQSNDQNSVRLAEIERRGVTAEQDRQF